MTDAIDLGCQREQEDRDRALAAQAAKPAMPPLGFCYNCDAALIGKRPLPNPPPLAGEGTNEKGYLQSLGCFCGVDCRDDYEKREKQRV